MTSARKILITAALPYANGPIHLGHMVEYIQTDIWARFQRARGHEAYFIWADDTHGTPIMLHARRRGIEPEQLIEQMNAEHQRDFRDFGLAYDYFGSTHSQTNRALVERIWARLQAGGYVETHTIQQFYDPDKAMFLPDRFIRGTCPRCAAPDQHGDSCEACGAAYEPTELQDPTSALSGATPELRDTEHYFFRLQDFTGVLREWIGGAGLQDEVRNKLEEWFEQGLKAWDVSRDEPYFGFAIPGTDKYFYVWVDAPVGYMAAFAEFCRRQDLDFDAWWSPQSDAELYHFIGKDIVYFHALFWPAMLHGAGFRMPTAVFAHGFLTVDGAKMSKSRGTFIMARTYLDNLEPDYLRYYFAARLGSGVGDVDLNLEDFRQRVNSDLVGKLVNVASRCAGFVRKLGGNRLAAALPEPGLYRRFLDAGADITADYENRNFQGAMRRIMALADAANQYVNDQQPWVLAREAGNEQQVVAICTQGLNLFRLLVAWLTPVIPFTAARAAEFLDSPVDDWQALEQPLLDHPINRFKPLLQRVEESSIEAIIEQSRESLGAANGVAPNNDSEPSDMQFEDQIEIDQFKAVDLRIARIERAETVEGADKLLRLSLDLGGPKRTVLAGISKVYNPEQLEGRLTVVVANLKPRKMRFGTSEGMVLAAADDSGGPCLLSPDSGAQPGMRVS